MHWRSKRATSIQSDSQSSSSQETEHHIKDIEALNKAVKTISIPIRQDAPILKLPVELIQYISTYLPNVSAMASFSLSSRYLYYAIGTLPLSTHINGPVCPPTLGVPGSYSQPKPSKVERRQRREILERAFPSQWYCGWCDEFHVHEASMSPKLYSFETKRDCGVYNSYLHDDKNQFVLCYHHVRLALNRHTWGPEYGIGLDAFTYTSSPTRRKLWAARMEVSTILRTRARIVNGRLLLNVIYSISFETPSRLRQKGLAKHLLPYLPQILVGHRDSREPHTGLHDSLNKAVTCASRTSGHVHLCCVCATDFAVAAHHFPARTIPGSQDNVIPPATMVRISVWRDLGNGRNPFDSSWRAHGEIGHGKEGFAQDLWRLAQLRPGSIRESFEKNDNLQEKKTDQDAGDIKCWIWEEEVFRKHQKESAKL